ncbi:expp1 protein isoform X1 [Zea mays]|uniref:Expp1 protein n=1 Tax=Zea mays TaxID=4577 RepID=B4FQT7_MAIZE|nr:expp1 protein isoform X1 [Zea mays]ACF84480.1 unknown [Zea mays]
MAAADASRTLLAAVSLALAACCLAQLAAGDTNGVYEPCSDGRIQRGDGFTFGVVFAGYNAFFSGNTQLSPCDRRLNLAASGQLAVFRPKASAGGFMVAFAGRKYAARSIPIFVSNTSVTVSSFTLVLEFNKGRLENLHWKKDGCGACSGKSNFVCLGKQTCAIRTQSCKSQGPVDCSVGIQLAFSGTDKHESVLNSWYEVSNLRQYSLYGLYSNLKGTLSGQFNKIF